MSELSKSNSGHRSPTKRKGHVPSVATATSHLLTSTKALLQSLTSWSKRSATVSEVSAKFVKFGDSFKTLKRSYNASGIDITTLPDIPKQVRTILEASLILEPSQQSLDMFLPQIGESVAELMKMLKDKQFEVSEAEKSKSNLSLSASLSTVSSLRYPGKSFAATPGATTTTSEHGSNDTSRTPYKDPLTRLQNNRNLIRRASKRYSAYQTSSIISIQSPMNSTSFDTSQLPKTPLYEDGTPNITSDDLENAKNDSSIFNNSTLEKNGNSTFPYSIKEEQESGQTPESDETEKEENAKEVKEVLNDTTDKLKGGRNERNDSVTDVFGGTRENHIFLKLKDQVKKVNIKLPTTVANVKVLFTQKFNYSSPGLTPYPKMYIQDGPASVAYELENMADVTDGSIISLQQPDLQSAIFKHVDLQIDGVKSDIMNMEDRLLKKIESMYLSVTSNTVSNTVRQSVEIDYEKNMKEKLEKNEEYQKLVDELQNELNKVKQHQNRSIKRITNMINGAIDYVDNFQESGIVLKDMTENSYISECKNRVSEGCESLVEKLDDLQDIIEFMKTDITKHNIKPSDKQLEHLGKEMRKTDDTLRKLTNYTQSERKNIAAIWNKQMALIAADQRFFKAQEEIMGLLEQDYQSAQETFELIKSCAAQLEKSSLPKSKLPIPDPSVSPWDASRLVMAEVDALNPNHEERVEAIAKAERVREMEKELRLKDEFQEELDEFVSNERLKKRPGGIEELERNRQEKDLQHIKNTLGVM